MGQVGLILLRRTPWQTLWRPHRRPLRQPHRHKREPVNLTVGLSVNLTVPRAPHYKRQIQTCLILDNAKIMSTSKRNNFDAFGRWVIENSHAVAAQRPVTSQNAGYTIRSHRFWQVRCSKRARRCGTKHMPKSKCKKSLMLGAFWTLRCRKSACCRGAKLISKSKWWKVV